MSETKRVMVLPGCMLDDNTQQYYPCDQVELAAAEARNLAEAGMVELVDTTGDAEDMELLFSAINGLDSADASLWTKDGKPTTKAVSSHAGRSVSAKERDTAWAMFKAAMTLSTERP